MSLTRLCPPLRRLIRVHVASKALQTFLYTSAVAALPLMLLPTLHAPDLLLRALLLPALSVFL